MSFLIGLLSGLFGGIAGGGGGVISIVLMVGIMKLDQHTAHGVSLVALVLCQGFCAAGHHPRGHGRHIHRRYGRAWLVRWDLARRICITADIYRCPVPPGKTFDAGKMTAGA